jgi:2-phosphosulfolactate phosphatase
LIVDVAPLPGNVHEIERKVAIVVDALRASATIATMLDSGAEAIVIAADPSEALAIASAERQRYLVCGESGGLAPAGFDFGNSPGQLASINLAGRRVVLSTSNGTRALRAVAHAQVALVGGGRNAAAVARQALELAARSHADLAIVCAGDEFGRLFSLEDFFFAGFLVELIADLHDFGGPVDESNPRHGDPACWTLDESAIAARRLYRSYLSPGEDPTEPTRDSILAMFQDSRNGHTLPRLGYASDLQYCAEVNRSSTIPRLSYDHGRFVIVPHA